jgi:uncharacterized protein (TIGR02996 family)
VKDDEALALMRGILAEPDDDAPRLVYADWLEEHGQQERGQHIRLQCRAAALPEGDPRRAKLTTEADALEAKHLREWLGPLDPEHCRNPNKRGHFERGLLYWWYCTVATFISKKHQQDAAEWFPRLGVNRTCITESSKKAEALAGSPGLAWTSEFCWLRSKAEDAPLIALFGSPHLELLSSLMITHPRCTDAALTALSKSRGLPRLRTLAMSDCTWGGEFSAKGLQRVLDSGHLPALSELRLTEGAPHKLKPVDLARSSGFSRLTRLSLSDGWASPASIAALADNPHVAGLERLDLSENDIDEAAALKLADSPHLSGLKELDLTDMNNHSGNRLPASAEARLRERFGPALRFAHGVLVRE